MSRPRIRTLKPEFWDDERVGTLSRDARLLVIALLTMADDEGRLRALPALIIGHAYPYDADAPRRLPRWLAEVYASGVVVAYEHDGKPYAAFRNWARHQLINRPSPSLLPAPPDPEIVAANAVGARPRERATSRNAHGTVTERSQPPARAGAPADRNGSERTGDPPTPRKAGGHGPGQFWDELNSTKAAAAPGGDRPRRRRFTKADQRAARESEDLAALARLRGAG